MRGLRVNQTKVTLKNAFIVNFFALKSEKKSKNEERTLFRDSPRILDLSVWSRMPHICDSLDCFSLRHFLATSCCFENFRLSSLNSALNFGSNKSFFCRLDVLVCCCAANQYSGNCLHFFKNFEKQCAL